MNIDLPEQTLPKYIVIEGPIGVGKTTLAKRLAHLFRCQTILEQAEDNPFLAQFYQNQQQNALATQLFFLFQRTQQLEQLQQLDLFADSRIADFMIEKDQLFAEMLLNQDEFKLYNSIYQKLVVTTIKPDLVIYLQAPTHTLVQRIQKRGLAMEQYISADYLEKTNQAYSRFFHFYDDAPLLIINAEQIDEIYHEANFKQLINYILTIQNGRHYFNPSLANEVLL